MTNYCNPIGGAHISAPCTKIAQEFPDPPFPEGLARETRSGHGPTKILAKHTNFDLRHEIPATLSFLQLSLVPGMRRYSVVDLGGAKEPPFSQGNYEGFPDIVAFTLHWILVTQELVKRTYVVYTRAP